MVKNRVVNRGRIWSRFGPLTLLELYLVGALNFTKSLRKLYYVGFFNSRGPAVMGLGVGRPPGIISFLQTGIKSAENPHYMHGRKS